MLPVFAYGLAARRKYGDIFKVGNMDNVYLVGGLRSCVGVVNGMYRHVPAEKLGAAEQSGATILTIFYIAYIRTISLLTLASTWLMV